MEETIIPEEILAHFRYAIEEARKDPERYQEWIKGEIEACIALINTYDKIYVMGALGAKLIAASPNLYNQFVDAYQGPGKAENEGALMEEDEHVEVLLEYLMSICLATANNNAGVIPTSEQINEIYQRLLSLKTNFSFLEISKNVPVSGDGSDEWIRNSIVQDTMNVRGDGYHQHIIEVYQELFAPYDDFLEQFYGFNSGDILKTILKWDDLVMSKVGGPFGAGKANERMQRWEQLIGGEKELGRLMAEQLKNPFQLFGEANPDITIPGHGFGLMNYPLNAINSYNKIFWVIPENQREAKVFEKLSTCFGSNCGFFTPPKFKAFLMNDSIIRTKPLIKDGDKYYHFSLQLAFRNIFRITENLIKDASEVYYQANYRNNDSKDSRDNYLERKVKSLFEKMLPGATFYRSLEYFSQEGAVQKRTELDILGVSEENLYIIEVKAGELNDKHRRGYLKGLKDRMEETIDYGAYQCHRAKTYIEQNQPATFEYIDQGTRKKIAVEASKATNIHKITLTFEHFATLSINLKYLVNSGLLKEDYKWSWIVSLYDLMIFSEIIDNEVDFNDYLENRLGLYDREDIQFNDEVDILGFFLEGNFPLADEVAGKSLLIAPFGDDIDNYFTKTGVGMFTIEKPKRKK